MFYDIQGFASPLPVAVLSLISSSFINVADVNLSRSIPLLVWKNSTIAFIVLC